jgi:hypothetical protein
MGTSDLFTALSRVKELGGPQISRLKCQLDSVIDAVGAGKTVVCTIQIVGFPDTAGNRLLAMSNDSVGATLTEWVVEPGHDPFAGTFKSTGYIFINRQGNVAIQWHSKNKLLQGDVQMLCLGSMLYGKDASGTDFTVDLNVVQL